ncbi:FecR domain-containing protein [Azospirillum sp. C340-1]|uniref:FecR domain-containing protein n=2 Tax=Azospirillum isscasi TaxID=3053926 RepID=A0ABU0WBH6_9PROT|nr:FecR domain-containing protein [Azospirillum isscasi]
MDADSTLSVSFTAGERSVRLSEGRAHFVTAPDPERPFVVTCANGRVTTANASFVVHRCLDSVVVAVETGTATLAAGAEPPLPIAAGQSRSYGPGGPGPLLNQGVAVESAWRQGRLVFQGQPLDAVIADLNRYHPARILLWDRPLAGLRFDGSVDISRPDAALNAIVRTLPLRTLRPFPGLVIVRSA